MLLKFDHGCQRRINEHADRVKREERGGEREEGEAMKTTQQ
jgi:hypothetical protein